MNFDSMVTGFLIAVSFSQFSRKQFLPLHSSLVLTLVSRELSEISQVLLIFSRVLGLVSFPSSLIEVQHRQSEERGSASMLGIKSGWVSERLKELSGFLTKVRNSNSLSLLTAKETWSISGSTFPMKQVTT